MDGCVGAGRPRRYNDHSGRIKYTLNYHHHAKRVNIDRCNDVRGSVFHYHAKRVNTVGDNDTRTHIIIAIENGGLQYIGQAKTRMDICN